MYNFFFNFQEPPFNLTPDPRFVYLSPGHQETLEHMVYGVRERKGFVMIVGDIGAGKTTLTRLFLDQLDEQTHTALIFNTYLNEIELLRAINREFGLPAKGTSREDLVQILNQFLIQVQKQGGNAIIILDEAQNLSVAVLEQIRMLSNLETDAKKLLQIILVGQPELARTMARPDLAQLNQRITVRCHLPPLDLEDTIRYIHHRLSVAGPQNQARFHPRTYRLVHKYTEGVPRRINALCDRALLVAFGQNSHTVTTAYIRRSWTELSGDPTVRTEHGFWNRLVFYYLVPAAMILAVIAAVGYLAYNRWEVVWR